MAIEDASIDGAAIEDALGEEKNLPESFSQKEKKDILEKARNTLILSLVIKSFER